MKFTDKFKAKKTENQENPANESPKKEKKPLKQKIKDSMNKKYLKNGSYSVVISAIFIVIVLVINMIVGSLPTKYTEVDVSSEKLYSISDDTKEFLKKLDNKACPVFIVSKRVIYLGKIRTFFLKMP